MKYEGRTCFRSLLELSFVSERILAARATLHWAGVILILGSSIAAKLFTCYSHAHFSLSASGLRLETGPRTDKEISEVYFAARPKKILTQNLNRQVSNPSNKTSGMGV